MCQVTQKFGFFGKRIKVFYGLLGQHAGLGTGSFGAQHRDEGGLSRRRIAAHRLAQLARVALGIEQIVDDLVGQPQVVGVGMQGLA